MKERIHLTPIILTKYGETLEEYPNPSGYETDDCGLSTCVGVHSRCNGYVDIKEVSQTHSALHCRACGLRLIIPKDVDTWSKLKYFYTQEATNAKDS